MQIKESYLKTYYEMWRTGGSANDIRLRLGLGRRKFREYEPYFLQYCRKYSKIDEGKRLMTGGPNAFPLTKERRNDFLGYMFSGLDYQKASQLMNIPLTTIMDFWFKDDGFKAQVDLATEYANAKVTQSLFKNAIGYEYYEDHEEEVTEPLYNEKGNPIRCEISGEQKYGVVQTRKKRIKKRKAPDVKAQQFWLANRDPNRWSMTGERASDSNKGTIVQYLEELGEEKKYFGKYDEQQQNYDDRYNKE